MKLNNIGGRSSYKYPYLGNPYVTALLLNLFCKQKTMPSEYRYSLYLLTNTILCPPYPPDCRLEYVCPKHTILRSLTTPDGSRPSLIIRGFACIYSSKADYGKENVYTYFRSVHFKQAKGHGCLFCHLYTPITSQNIQFSQVVFHTSLHGKVILP